MSQTRRQSLVEAWTSTVIGFVIAFIGWCILDLIMGTHHSVAESLGIVMYFTVLSILRGYFVRRLFNRYHQGELREQNKGA